MSTICSCMHLLLLLLTTFASLTTIVHSEKCHPQDKKALLQINKQLGNPFAWDPHTDCCGIWFGASCHPKTNRVDYIFFINLDLRRPFHIPSSIGDLPYLDMIEIRNVTKLTGPIPQSITKLTKLLFLTITQTSVTGQIPEFLSTIKPLFDLDLSDNKFFGPIPSSLSRLRNLVAINLEGNNFNGSIPDSFGFFGKGMKDLSLSRNQLSGNIPASFGRLNLSTVDLSWNKLRGDASMLLNGSTKRSNEIKLSNNLLAFDIGKVESLPMYLWTLDLNNNHIYGTLPSGLTTLNFLTELNVSYNGLCGKIPQGGTLQSFNVSSFAHNKCLCGTPLPTCN